MPLRRKDNHRKPAGSVALTTFKGALSGLLLLSLTLVLGGCAQETRIEKPTKLLAEPVLDRRLAEEDFAFPPTGGPRLTDGKKIYEQTCIKCHPVSYWQRGNVQNDLRHTTPIDMFLMLTSGKGRTPEEMHATPERWAVLPKNHPVFRDTLGRDDRWAAVFYTRYLAGDGDIHYTLGGGKKMNREDIASVFGGNCAVCHGKKGNGEGTLYTGHPPGHELAVSPVHGGLFYPPPANFTSANRLYNRTDAQLFKYIAEGIYPSAMPPWMGKVDKAGGFTFDDPMIWNLVRHIRSFGYQDDLGLSEDQVPKAGTPAASAVGARGTSGEITGHATRPELAPATKATPTDVSEGSAQVEATAPSPAKAGQTANPSQSKAGGEAARSGGAKR